MKGFFGILNLKEAAFTEAKEKYICNNLKTKTSFHLELDEILLADFNSTIDSTTIFNNLHYVGWCRLDNINELQNSLNLKTTTLEKEVIISSYVKWGERCVDHFIGDFSFVVWDSDQQTLFLAKDQMGIRPLFYMEQNGLFYFGTTIPEIKAALLEPPLLNKLYIAKELRNFPQEVEDTFFKDIKRLKPAHYISLKLGGKIEEKRYWELESVDLINCKSEEDYLDLLRATFTEAVLCRTRNKKNVGCQLSGGMDSSAIAVLLSRLIDKNHLHSYSFVLSDLTRAYSDNGIDEQGTQEEIIKYADLRRENHHPITSFDLKDVNEEFIKKNEIMGGVANSDAIWQDSLYKNAANNDVDVMFSGFPGDEGISQTGSNYYFDYLNDCDVRGLFNLIISFRRASIKKIIKYYKQKKANTTYFGFAEIQEKRNLLNKKSKFYAELIDSSFTFNPSFKSWQKEQICRSHTTLRSESEGTYANQYDLETVYPLADIRLLTIMYSLPTKLFKPIPYSRALFRNICKGILPDKVRLQIKSNGAKTLAFADYWIYNKAEELKDYKLSNSTGLLISLEEYQLKEAENEFMKMRRLNQLKEIDYLIELNLPTQLF